MALDVLNFDLMASDYRCLEAENRLLTVNLTNFDYFLRGYLKMNYALRIPRSAAALALGPPVPFINSFIPDTSLFSEPLY